MFLLCLTIIFRINIFCVDWMIYIPNYCVPLIPLLHQLKKMAVGSELTTWTRSRWQRKIHRLMRSDKGLAGFADPHRKKKQAVSQCDLTFHVEFEIPVDFLIQFMASNSQFPSSYLKPDTQMIKPLGSYFKMNKFFKIISFIWFWKT